MIGWIAGGVWLALAASTIALCRAAANGDRAMHAHHPPLDEDDRAWAELVRRLEEPTTWCAACGQRTFDGQLFCDDACQTAWLS